MKKAGAPPGGTDALGEEAWARRAGSKEETPTNPNAPNKPKRLPTKENRTRARNSKNSQGKEGKGERKRKTRSPERRKKGRQDKDGARDPARSRSRPTSQNATVHRANRGKQPSVKGGNQEAKAYHQRREATKHEENQGANSQTSVRKPLHPRLIARQKRKAKKNLNFFHSSPERSANQRRCSSKSSNGRTISFLHK